MSAAGKLTRRQWIERGEELARIASRHRDVSERQRVFGLARAAYDASETAPVKVVLLYADGRVEEIE